VHRLLKVGHDGEETPMIRRPVGAAAGLTGSLIDVVGGHRVDRQKKGRVHWRP
jgi:hypothetical protein